MDEKETVRRCRAGEVEALGALFREYHLRVFRTALGILRDQDAAEDVTQQVFVELPRSLTRFDCRRPLAPWLYRLAVNISLDSFRRSKHRSDSLDTALDVPSPEPGPDDIAEDRERRMAIHLALGLLDARQRAVVVLRYYQGLSEAEMATALGCRRGTVKSRLHYALRALQEALSRDPLFDGSRVAEWTGGAETPARLADRLSCRGRQE